MARAAGNGLGELEQLVMNYVWNNRGCTAEECREATAQHRRLRESTIRTVLTRLEQKGMVTHEIRGRTFFYEAVSPKSSFAARAVRKIVDQLCGGSVEQLLLGLVDNSVVDRKTLETVVRKIPKPGTK